MPRKRLRTFLDEVIGDADLRASVDRVADVSPPTDSPPLTLASATADGAEAVAVDASALPAESPLGSEIDVPIEAPIIELHPAAFPPPPWEAPPEAPRVANGHAIAPPPAAAVPAAALVDVAAAALDTPPADPDEANAVLADAPGVIDALPTLVLEHPPPPFDAEAPTATRHAPAFTDEDLSTALVEHPHASAVAATPSAPAVVLAAAAVAPVAAPPAEPSARRRRRSASLLPPLPSPTDIPEDAEGRIAIISNPAPVHDPATTPAPALADAEPAPITAVGGDVPLAGWLPVLALGAALVVIFIVGVLVTR